MLFWFIFLFALSWLPWLLALLAEIDPEAATEKDKKILKGLAIIDFTLTVAAAMFLVLAIGWYALIAFGIMIGLGFILEAFEVQPYKAMASH